MRESLIELRYPSRGGPEIRHSKRRCFKCEQRYYLRRRCWLRSYGQAGDTIKVDFTIRDSGDASGKSGRKYSLLLNSAIKGVLRLVIAFRWRRARRVSGSTPSSTTWMSGHNRLRGAGQRGQNGDARHLDLVTAIAP